MSETNVPAIVGEVEAGRAATVRRAINKLVAATNTNTFDLAELLHEAKSKNYYAGWGFESFSKYAKSLAVKYTKSYYLVRIVENMKAAGLEREQYEPVGLGKLRTISRLKPDTEYHGTPVSLLIRELTLKAGQMTPEQVQFEVDTIMGLTEDESLVWLNIKVKKLARENVIKPAFDKMRKHLGTVPDEDEEGQNVDAKDGRVLELICANFLADPNYDTPEAAVSPSGETTESSETDAGSIYETEQDEPVEEDFNDA